MYYQCYQSAHYISSAWVRLYVGAARRHLIVSVGALPSHHAGLDVLADALMVVVVVVRAASRRVKGRNAVKIEDKILPVAHRGRVMLVARQSHCKRRREEELFRNQVAHPHGGEASPCPCSVMELPFPGKSVPCPACRAHHKPQSHGHTLERALGASLRAATRAQPGICPPSVPRSCPGSGETGDVSRGCHLRGFLGALGTWHSGPDPR